MSVALSTIRSYSAKLLLFGEYSVLAGSDAFAFPWPAFSGSLQRIDLKSHTDPILGDSNSSLRSLLAYLESADHCETAGEILDMDRLSRDIIAGLTFKSDIPVNYGLGSSGALVAALYDSYRNPENAKELTVIRDHLAFIESAFHARSSGTDPLVSFLGRPVFIRNGRVECPAANPEQLSEHLHISLIDSGMQGTTRAGVTSFDPGSATALFTSEYIPLVNSLVNHIYRGRFENLFEQVLRLSSLQLQLMPQLFTPGIRAEAGLGLLTGAFAIKLCGSGGGGFYLKMEPAEA